jgi:5-methylcytosine-specific restriction endonuclease McrA
MKDTQYPWMQSATNDKLGYTKASRLGAYARAKWRKLREFILNESPLCTRCYKKGIITPAVICDHVIPINGENDPLFYELSNISTLCDECHRIKTRQDNSRFSKNNLEKGKALMKDLES